RSPDRRLRPADAVRGLAPAAPGGPAGTGHQVGQRRRPEARPHPQPRRGAGRVRELRVRRGERTPGLTPPPPRRAPPPGPPGPRGGPTVRAGAPLRAVDPLFSAPGRTPRWA